MGVQFPPRQDLSIIYFSINFSSMFLFLIFFSLNVFSIVKYILGLILSIFCLSWRNFHSKWKLTARRALGKEPGYEFETLVENSRIKIFSLICTIIRFIIYIFKSLVILAIWLVLSSAIYSQIASFLALNRIIFTTNQIQVLN